MKLRFLFPHLFGLILLASPAAAQRCPVDYGFQGSYNFGHEAKSFTHVHRLSEIDGRIITRINEQLTKRVGNTFFAKLRFDYGTVEDWDDTRSLSPSDSGRIDGYDFVFKFSDRRKGLKAFHFKVVANSFGTIIDDLALPDIAAAPEKADLIPCERALSVAAKNSFPRAFSSIYFVYDRESMTFTWEVHDGRPVAPDEPTFALVGQGTYRHIVIDAHTGAVLKVYKQTIVV